MPTTKREELTTLMEELEAEIDELSRRRAEAVAQIRHAEERFEELEERRSALSPKTFSGDKEAAAELEQVEDEHDRIARSSRVARSAVPEFDRMIKEAKGRLGEAREGVHRKRYEELARERYTLDEEIEAAADKLAEGLDRLSNLDGEQYTEGRAGGLDPSYDIHDLTRGWLSSRFRDYLPFGAEVQEYYRKPLVEVDRKASGPEA